MEYYLTMKAQEEEKRLFKKKIRFVASYLRNNNQILYLNLNAKRLGVCKRLCGNHVVDVTEKKTK